MEKPIVCKDISMRLPSSNHHTHANNHTKFFPVIKCKKKMLIHYLMINLIVVIIFISGFIGVAEAGTCWMKNMDNGKCKGYVQKNITKGECCDGGKGLGFSDRNIDDVEAFFISAFKESYECKPCVESCDTIVCGANKRCVMRNGSPKCICAPNCKQPKSNKKKFQNINVVLNANTNNNSKNNNNNNSKVRNLNKLKNDNISNNHNNNNNDSLKKNLRVFKENLQISNDSNVVYVSNVNNSSNSNIINNSKDNNNNNNNHNNSNLNKKKNQRNLRNHNQERTIQMKALPLNKQTEDNGGDFAQVSATRSGKIITTITAGERRTNPNVRHKNKKIKSSNGDGEGGNANRTIDNDHQQHRTQSPHHKRRKFLTKSGDRPTSTLSSNQSVLIESRFRNGNFNNEYYDGQLLRTVDLQNEISKQNHGTFLNPVCGTDGKTYKTECQLKKRACRQESTTLTVAYKGHCQTSCKFVICPNGKQCVEDQNSMPHCIVCSNKCDPGESMQRSFLGPAPKYVCGVDGITYNSLCELKQKACTTGKAVPLAYHGPCIDAANCDNVNCKDRQVCLTDLTTHKPRCVTCGIKCPRSRPPGQRAIAPDVKICGTNNHTYHSWCHKRKDSCNTGFFIDVKHFGSCAKPNDDGNLP